MPCPTCGNPMVSGKESTEERVTRLEGEISRLRDDARGTIWPLDNRVKELERKAEIQKDLNLSSCAQHDRLDALEKKLAQIDSWSHDLQRTIDRRIPDLAQEIRETKTLLQAVNESTGQDHTRLRELERKAGVHQDSDRLKIEVFDAIDKSKRLDAIEKRLGTLEKRLDLPWVDDKGLIHRTDPLGGGSIVKSIPMQEQIDSRLERMNGRVGRLEMQRLEMRSAIYAFLEATKK